jgi:trigger factor
MEKQLVVETKLEDVNSISQKLTVTVPPQHIKRSAKKALAEVKKDAKVPGFRKGKVPDEMIKQRMGEAYTEEVVRQIVRDSYPEAVKLSNAHPISDPRIETATVVVDESKPYVYSAIFEVYPKVEPKDFTGMKLEKEKVQVSKEEVENELNALQQQMTQLEPAPDATLTKGVLARVDFKGTADGRTFEGSEAKDFIVDLEAKNLLPEFEKQIEGMKENEERKIEFSYPPDYFNKEIAGKKGTYEVKCKELRRKVVPEFNDDFAKDLGPFKTMDDVRKTLNDRIAWFKEGQQHMQLHRQVMENFSKEQPIDVPDVMVSSELGSMLEEFSKQLESQGKTIKDIGLDPSTFVRDHMSEAQLRVRGYIIANAIAQREKITVTDEEVGHRLKAIAQQTGEQEAKVRKHFTDNNMLGGLKAQMLIEKTLDYVIDKAKVKETSGKKAEAEKPKKESKPKKTTKKK